MAVINLIDTTFTAKDIHTALSVYEYTATGTYRLAFQVRLYQVAGGGDYTIYLQLNDGDALADDTIAPKTTYTAAAGAQNLWFQSGNVDVLNGDVINVMALGLAGDTAVTGSIRIFADDAVGATTYGATLDVSATGEAGLDFSNIKAATNPTTLTNITVPVVTSITNAVLSNLTQILGTALTETIPTQLAAAFIKFLDVTGPTGSVNSLPNAIPGAANGLFIAGTNAQTKIVANAANEGALDIRNSNANGIGTYNQGGDVGLYNDGTTLYGQYNVGADTGLYNNGTGAAAYGNYNAGVAIGQYNAASGAASAGQTNQGVADGQYNFGTTYGQQNTGASGQVNVGTAGVGSYNSGTTYGIQAVGVTADTDPAFPAAAPTANAIADQVWDEAIAGHLAAGSTGAALNAVGGGATVFPSGAIEFTYTVTDSSTTLPLEGVEVWISTDNPAVNIVWKGDTDAFGIAMDVLGNKPKLDAGTYYFWRQLAGYTFSDPDVETVS